MLDEEGGGDHAHAVVHVAGAPELAHAGVDDRIAGSPRRPGAEARFVAAEGKALEFRPQGTRREVGTGEEERRREVAPAEFGEELLHMPPDLRPGFGGARGSGGDAARRDLAEA